MDYEYVQRFALKASIKKWKKNLKQVKNKKLPVLGYNECACCKVYKAPCCEGCPISDYNGVSQCRDTPYYSIVDAAQDSNVDWEELKKLVESEVELLEKILNSL